MKGRSRRTRVAAFLLFVLYPPFAYSHGIQNRLVSLVDFPSFYGAVRLAAAGQSPYGPHALDAFAAGLGRPVFPFIYPPLGLLPFVPLAWLSYEPAAMLMLVLSHAAVLVFLWYFCVRSTDGAVDARGGRAALLASLMVAYVVAFDPLAVNFQAGQTNALILFSLAMALHALERRQAAIAGAALALACLFKIYFLLFIPFLILKRQSRAIVWLAGILAAAFVVTTVLWPVSLWGHWLREVLPFGGYGRYPPGLFPPGRAANQSVNGFIARMLAGDPELRLRPILPLAGAAAPLAYAVCGALIAGGLAAVHRSTQRFGDSRLAVEFSLLLMIVFLVTPFSWEHYLVFLLPAAIIVLSHLVEATALDWQDIAAAGGLLLLAWPVPFHDAALRRGALRLLISAKFYGVVILGVYLLRELFSTPSEAGLAGGEASTSGSQLEQPLNRRSTVAT